MKKYKYLLYKLASIKYGKIKGFKTCQHIKDIKVKKLHLGSGVFKKIYIAQNCRLYTDRIHTLGLIHKNYLIDGPSYQIIDNNFESVKNNIILRIGTPRLKRNLNGTIACLLSGGGANNNYWHWLFDVLPRLKIINEVINLKKIDYLLIPSVENKYQLETLSILGFNKEKLLSSKMYRHISSDNIIVTDHPWVNSNNSSKDELKMPIWIFKWLKKIFLTETRKVNKKKSPKLIFIKRKKILGNQRYLKNEREINKIFKKKGFKFVNLESYSFINQIKLFNGAKIIAGVHGAGFANIIFCKKNTSIIEFKTRGSGNIIKNVAIKNKLKYLGFISRSSSIENNQNGEIDIDISKLKNII